MIPFPLFLALKYLKPKRNFTTLIPIITTTGVILGVAILIIVLAVMTGFGDTWREKILSFKPHITIYPEHNSKYIENSDEVCDVLENTPCVISACPTIISPVMLRYYEEDPPITATIIGIDTNRTSILSALSEHIIMGAYDISENKVILGMDMAFGLKAPIDGTFLCYSPLNLNTDGALYFPEEMILSGIYNMGMRDIDSGIVITSIELARDIIGLDRGAAIIHVQVDNPEIAFSSLGTILKALHENFPNQRFMVNTWEQEDKAFFNALKTEKTMMFVLLAFIAIVAAFCVTNTLIVIILQKTGEIGLLKAIGFSPARLMTTFVLYGLIQCIIGIVLGVIVAYKVLQNLQGMVNLLASLGFEVFPKSVYGLAEIPWRIVQSDVISVVSIVLVFCFVASLLPAWWASSMNPARAMNQE